jgi:hypothetical protein
MRPRCGRQLTPVRTRPVRTRPRPGEDAPNSNAQGGDYACPGGTCTNGYCNTTRHDCAGKLIPTGQTVVAYRWFDLDGDGLTVLVASPTKGGINSSSQRVLTLREHLVEVLAKLDMVSIPVVQAVVMMVRHHLRQDHVDVEALRRLREHVGVQVYALFVSSSGRSRNCRWVQRRVTNRKQPGNTGRGAVMPPSNKQHVPCQSPAPKESGRCGPLWPSSGYCRPADGRRFRTRFDAADPGRRWCRARSTADLSVLESTGACASSPVRAHRTQWR